MRFLLVSAEQPSIKKCIDIPDRLVNKSVISKKKSGTKKQAPSKMLSTKTKQVKSINKPVQTSKPIILKNGPVYHRNKRSVSK